MLDHVIYVYGFNLNFAKMLVSDISPEQMCQQPNGVVNHPAWTLGHLTNSAAGLLKTLGKEASLPEKWGEAFATGGVPSNDPSVYPSKDELLSTLSSVHDQVIEALNAIDHATFSKPHPNENVRKYFPTLGDMIVFLMTGHEMDHLGQLAAWRRAMGLGSATGV